MMKDTVIHEQRVLEHRTRRLLAGFIWAAIIAGSLLFLSRANLLPEGPDEWTVDWRTLLFSKVADQQREDIAVVMINEDSIARYPYLSPVNRKFLAELITAIAAAKPKAIGIDFIFDRPTEPQSDEALINALKALNKSEVPVILGAIDERSNHIRDSSLTFQQNFIASTGLNSGHIYFALEEEKFTFGDQVVRFFAGASENPPNRQAFARLLAETDGPKAPLASNYIAWLLPPNSGAEDTFATFYIPTHTPGAAKEMLPPDFHGALKDKIVLVGGDFIDRDKHLTPLSVADKVKIPGVLIHAQILAQMIDERSIIVFNDYQEFVALVIVASIGFFLGWQLRLQRYEWLVYVVGVGVLGLIGAIAFWQFKLLIPSTTLFLAWVSGVFGGNYSERLFKRIARIQ